MGGFAVLVCVECEALFHVVFPVALVFGSVCVVEHSVAFSDTVGPVALVPVPKVLALAFGL